MFHATQWENASEMNCAIFKNCLLAHIVILLCHVDHPTACLGQGIPFFLDSDFGCRDLLDCTGFNHGGHHGEPTDRVNVSSFSVVFLGRGNHRHGRDRFQWQLKFVNLQGSPLAGRAGIAIRAIDVLFSASACRSKFRCLFFPIFRSLCALLFGHGRPLFWPNIVWSCRRLFSC